mgnify:CR=1 FL=1
MTRIVACGRWTAGRAEALVPLREAGFVVEVCGDGAGTLESVVRRVPDVLVYAAEGDDSWDAGTWSIVRRTCGSIPLVVVTADGSVEERLRLAAVRPAYVAVDPIDPGELVQAIRELTAPRAGARPRR